jgi:LPS-assembly protein
MPNFMRKDRGSFPFCLNNQADFLLREGICPYPGILLIIFAFIFMFYSDVFAGPEIRDRLFKDDNNSNEPWNLTADEINHDRNTDIYTASGNVIITKSSRKLTADFVRFDHKAFHAHAQGNVKLKAGEDVLTGSSLDMDLKSEIGTVHDGTIFLKENNFNISGKSIEKTGEKSYLIEEATVSTCDGVTPDWKVTGKKLTVDVEGYGFINHATFWTKKLPVMYTPFLVFPAKIKRQSGLLAPEMGQSERKGIEYNQPFFWAINESSDATFYAHHMSERGEKAGFEYRYVLSKQNKGTLMFDFLHDRKQDDGTNDSGKKWGYSDDSYLRPNSDRYWLRMKHDQKLPDGFNAKVDIDIVSDQDYLHEFKDGYNGFDATESYYKKYFGREIDNYDDPVRTNRVNLNKNWPSYSLNAEARWYDNVVNRRWKDTDNTLHMLPLIEFNASKQKISGTPFYADLDSEYTNFYRKDGTSGQRADFYPRVYLPYRFRNYFSFEPSLGLRHTTWYIDPSSDIQITEKTHNREMYDVKLDLSTEVYSVFKLNGESLDSIKHTIKPQIIYQFIPDKDQAGYPNFDSLDRIVKSNLVTYSLINTFTSKKPLRNPSSNGSITEEKPSFNYNEFLRIKLEQSFDINEEKEDSPANWANKKSRRPFSPIYGELKLTPLKYLSLSTDAKWSQYDSKFISRNGAGTIFDARGDSISAEYRFERDSIESLLSNLKIKITEKLSINADYEENLRDNIRIRTGLGFLYTAQCWSIDVKYTDEVNDKKYFFMVNFTGLGGIGN